jgi:hypothetical protein
MYISCEKGFQNVVNIEKKKVSYLPRQRVYIPSFSLKTNSGYCTILGTVKMLLLIFRRAGSSSLVK